MRLLTDDVIGRVAAGVFQEQHFVSVDDRRELLDEIRLIGTRLGIEGRHCPFWIVPLRRIQILITERLLGSIVHMSRITQPLG